MPNGRLFSIMSIQFSAAKKVTRIYEINQKELTFELKYESKSHYFCHGAVTSLINEIFMSGNKEGRTKACASFNFSGGLDGDVKVRNLPEINFGRYDHSMITFNQRYLYIFGGKFIQQNYYSQNCFERLDLKNGKHWELIHFSWRDQDAIGFGLLFTSVAMVPFS